MSYQPLSFFGPDEHSYNCGSSMEGDDADDSGRPGIGLVASAIQFWALQNIGKSCTIGRAAAVFNMPAEAVAEAIDHHCWMFRHEDAPLLEQQIEHDGE